MTAKKTGVPDKDLVVDDDMQETEKDKDTDSRVEIGTESKTENHELYKGGQATAATTSMNRVSAEQQSEKVNAESRQINDQTRKRQLEKRRIQASQDYFKPRHQ